MNEFKSKTIIPDYVIRMKLKQGTVFPISELIICSHLRANALT